MTVDLLKIFSLTMWKRYTAPITKQTATSAVAVPEMGTIAFAFALSIICVFSGFGVAPILSLWIPAATYILYVAFGVGIYAELDKVLDYELNGNKHMAQEAADRLRKQMKRATLAAASVTAIWAAALLGAKTLDYI